MPEETKTKKEIRAEERAARKAARKAAKKAKRQAKVRVIVRVEGQVAFDGQATIPGYDAKLVKDEHVEAAIRSAALRVVATAKLTDSAPVRKKLHEVHEESSGR